MKGTFFCKPLELSLTVCGESWNQGSLIKGDLSIKNHGTDDVLIADYGVHLSSSDFKKVKAQNLKGLSFLESTTFTDGLVLKGGNEQKLEYSFQLKNDCPIAEKSKGLHIVCATKESPFDGGMLELEVLPIPLITSFLELFENFKRFKVKGVKYKKGYIEAKMIPPDSKEMGGIEQLNLLLKVDSDNLMLSYEFKTNKLVYEGGGVQTKLLKDNFEQILTSKEYSRFGAINQDGIIKAIDEVLQQASKTQL